MRMSIKAIVFRGFVVAGLGVVGCGGSDSGGGAGNTDQFIAQLCVEFSDCCRAAGRPSDGMQCRAFYSAFVPKSGYDASAASGCLDEVRASEDKCAAASSDTPSCGKVFATAGTKQPGEACEEEDDCAPAAMGDTTCASDYVDGATIQKCQVRLAGEAGSTPCVGTRNGSTTFSFGAAEGIPATGYICDLKDNLTCDGQSGACQALGAEGDPCTGGIYDCVASAYCDFAANACKTRVALGGACQDDDECVANAYCETASSTCAARAAAGAACAQNAECESDNCTNQKCGPKEDLALTFLCGTN